MYLMLSLLCGEDDGPYIGEIGGVQVGWGYEEIKDSEVHEVEVEIHYGE